MGRFRDRAREIKARGEEERGNWQPQEGSVPLKMYRYWAANTPSTVPDRENFCHYWRVVALWAPMIWAFNQIYSFVTSIVGQMIGVAAYVILAYFFWSTNGLQGISIFMLGIPWLALGIAAGLYVGVERERHPALLAATVVTFPISLPIIAMTAFVRWWPKWMTKLVQGVLVSLVVAMGLLLCYQLVTEVALLDILFGVVLLAAVVGIIAGVIYSATYISGRRAIKRDAEREARIQAIMDGTYHLSSPPERTPRKPGFIRRFFSGVGDMIIFAAQVVRVKKWKICPIVQIPDGEA